MHMTGHPPDDCRVAHKGVCNIAYNGVRSVAYNLQCKVQMTGSTPDSCHVAHDGVSALHNKSAHCAYFGALLLRLALQRLSA